MNVEKADDIKALVEITKYSMCTFKLSQLHRKIPILLWSPINVLVFHTDTFHA